MMWNETDMWDLFLKDPSEESSKSIMETCKIKFDGKNYATWKTTITLAIKGQMCQDLLEPNEMENVFSKWKEEDFKGTGATKKRSYYLRNIRL